MDVLLWSAAGVMVVITAICVLAALGRPLEALGRLLIELAEAALFVIVAIDLFAWAAGGGPAEPFTHVGYAVAAVAIIPILTRKPKIKGQADPQPESEPPSMWVLAVAALAIAVVLWRLAATG